MVPTGTETRGKQEGIFQLGNNQRILKSLESQGKVILLKILGKTSNLIN